MLKEAVLFLAVAAPVATAQEGCPYLLGGGNPVSFAQGMQKHPWLRNMVASFMQKDNIKNTKRRSLVDLTPVGSCTYTSAFPPPGAETCEEFYGDYSVESAETECAGMGDNAVFVASEHCAVKMTDAYMGVCVTKAGTEWEKHTVMVGGSGDCAMSVMGCEQFSGGAFYATNICPDAPSVDLLSAPVTAAVAPEPTASCTYKSSFPPFSDTCEEFYGEYSVESAAAECASVADGSVFAAGEPCAVKATDEFMGVCVNKAGTEWEKHTVMVGG
eukprot:CAMPEP_0197844624 /NCGR_PEP_ID=MMETSP1438-20131217/1628_1 /TAXON_ID=1461541 /ORGANISM="Pterosperma sp., Strain CCMP1384" /LENGTH=271 /DNA_ID=CAMNT_0043455539 /DNA_START=134 /DNA_END=946 /DNA_ORIENTATION=+